MLPPIMNDRINKFKELSREMDVVFGDGDIYEVLIDNKDGHVVNLETKESECGVWKIFGMPCVHALRCLNEIREDYYKYVSPDLTKDYCIITYK